jgi:uncharacterized protein
MAAHRSVDAVNRHLPALPPEGRTLRWASWHGDGIEEMTVRWENEGWTVDGVMHGADVQYVLRLGSDWRVHQFMLFRDLDDPDLWLATDGGGRWGEVNGAHRTDLDACTDIDIALTPATESLLVRRHALKVGHAAEVRVALVDVETLSVTPGERILARLADRIWCIEHLDEQRVVVASTEFEVDDLGFVIDLPDVARRLG